MNSNDATYKAADGLKYLVNETTWTPEQRGWIKSHIEAINRLAEKQQNGVGEFQEKDGGNGLILLSAYHYYDGWAVRLRDYMLQSTVATVDDPITNLPKILKEMQGSMDIVDAVVKYEKKYEKDSFNE